MRGNLAQITGIFCFPAVPLVLVTSAKRSCITQRSKKLHVARAYTREQAVHAQCRAYACAFTAARPRTRDRRAFRSA